MINIKEFFEKYELDEILINVLINIGLISTFIAIFFFTYGSIVEQDIIIKQAELITTDLISSIKPFMSKNDRQVFKNNLIVPDMSEEDNHNENNNNILKNSAYNNIIFIYSVCILSALLLAIYFIKPKHNYIFTMIINIILLIAVGFTEFTFLQFILVNYIIGDPNYVKYKLATSIRNKFIIPSNTK